MCDGIKIVHEERPIVNPAPEIGDIWEYKYMHEGVEGCDYFLILNTSEGPGYRNATVLDLNHPEIDLGDFLDTYAMMCDNNWIKVG